MTNDINVKETSDAELGRLKREAVGEPEEALTYEPMSKLDPRTLDLKRVQEWRAHLDSPEGRHRQVVEAFGKWWEREAGRYVSLTPRDQALMAWLGGACAALRTLGGAK